jgi:hypothetical protein
MSSTTDAVFIYFFMAITATISRTAVIPLVVAYIEAKGKRCYIIPKIF